MAANAQLSTSALLESDSELRELVRSILGGHTRGDAYLDEVFSICRRKPQTAGILREIIDRHARIGRMPRSQHRKIHARIDQARPRGADVQPPVPREDAERFEDQTCDLTPEPIAAATRGPARANSLSQPGSPSPPSRSSLQPNSPSQPNTPSQPNSVSQPGSVLHASSVRLERERLEGLVDTNPTLQTPPPARASGGPREVPAAVVDRADLLGERTELLTGRNRRVAEIAAIVAEHSDLIAERIETQQIPPLVRRTEPFVSAPAPDVPEPPDSIAPPALERPRPLEPPHALERPPLPERPFPPPPAVPLGAPPPPSEAEAADPPQSAVGLTLKNRYELQMLLGRGGMASVYRAVDRERVRLGFLERFVALKVMTNDPSHPARAMALLQEFQSAQRLSHPNIINVFDFDQVEDSTFYSMELLSGARLSQLVRRVDGSKLQRRYALAIIRDIGAAISHAHSRGVVHADLKPSNVMLTQQGEVRVLDFGGSSMPPREPWVSDDEADDAFHQATPSYASCEQLERRRADPRDDIYALACIAYLLLSGRHPFDHLSSLEARTRGLEPQRPAGMPRSQWHALRHGLMFERASQPESIDPWLARLGLEGAATRLPPLQDLTAPAETERPVQRAALLAAAVLVLTAGAWVVLSKAAPDWEHTLAGVFTAAWDSARETVAPTTAASDSVGDRNAAIPAAVSPAAAPSAAPPLQARPSVAPITPALPAAAPPAADPVATAATPPPGTSVNGGPHVAFTAQNYVVGPGDPAARIIIQREPGSVGDLNFIWWTEGGTAEPDVDYGPLGARTERLVSGQDKLTVYVPIISNPQRTRLAQFRVALVDAASHRGDGRAPSAHATVTIEGGR